MRKKDSQTSGYFHGPGFENTSAILKGEGNQRRSDFKTRTRFSQYYQGRHGVEAVVILFNTSLYLSDVSRWDRAYNLLQ